MGYNITQSEQRRIAGFHLVGPWEETRYLWGTRKSPVYICIYVLCRAKV